MFSTLLKTNFNFTVAFILLSANALNLDQSKILSFGKELNIGSNELGLSDAWEENIVEKGGNAGYQPSILSHILSKSFLSQCRENQGFFGRQFTLTTPQNLRLVQIGEICRQQ